ncbi:MAG: tRNA pseudouridine(38-40) synthase TruA [Dehalococcoidales bacterium]|nr:tRNA pseudouridine(38-40) synthase TruA [Dehalococcoidales bacterium]
MANTRIVLVVEYEGTRYHGFQWQANAPTIQGEIEKALRKLTKKQTRVLAASRTDTGVHAERQIVSFRTGAILPLAAYVNGLNHYLPEDIAVKDAFMAADTFDVRRQAVSREYNYYIYNSSTRSPLRGRFTYRVEGNLDIEAMDRACQELVGEHDLSSFATELEPRKRNMVKKVFRANVKKDGNMVTFSILANSYLPHQVRNTVGALLNVGRGKMTVDEFRSLVEAKKPALAGPAAPPQGLHLTQINYAETFGEDS